MNFKSSKNIIPDFEESSPIKTDVIVELKPESIKKDIIYFKEEVLKEIKILEKNLFQKSKEANEMLKDKLTTFDIKINLLKDNINTLSNRIIENNKNEEKINNLYQLKQKLLQETGTNKIKITLLEKEARDSINRINEQLKHSIIYPGVIGTKAKFNTFHDFIDFLLSESNANSTFRHKNIMDLSTFKVKIDKNIQTLAFKIESNLISSNTHTDTKVKDVQDKFDDTIRRYRKNLDDLRIENSDYVIQLEKDTKDLRNEIDNVKRLRNEIFNKIDTEIGNMKIENAKLMDNFKVYSEEIDIIKKDINRIDKRIEELILDKIAMLFDSQKITNENLDKFKNNFNETKNDLETKINDIKSHIKEDQSQLINSIEEINDKLNMICGNVLRTNTISQETHNDIYNNNNENESTNNNVVSSKEKRSTIYTTNRAKVKTFSSRNIKVKNLNNNNHNNNNNNDNNNINNVAHTVNINKLNLINSQKRGEIEKDQNYSYNFNNNVITPNIIPNLNKIYNINFNNNQKIINNNNDHKNTNTQNFNNNIINNNIQNNNNINNINQENNNYINHNQNNNNINNIQFNNNINNNNNNQQLNKKVLENLKISKIYKVGKTSNNQNIQNINFSSNKNRTYKNSIKNKINENILSELKNDNLIVLNNKKIYSQNFSPQSQVKNDLILNNLNNNNNLNINFKEEKINNNNKNLNIKKFPAAFRNKTALKARNKNEEEKDLDYDSYIKFFNLKKNIKFKRRSFNNEKIQSLQNFQKLLKLNINDVDAKLNDFSNISTASFKILNENKEIYDRFFLSNSNMDIKIEEKNTKNLNTNTNENNNRNKHRINLLNIYSSGNQSDKNSNEDYLNNKNMMGAKTSSYFYHLDPNLKKDKDFSLRPDSQNTIKFKRNNKIGLFKKTNSEIANLKGEVNRRPLGTNSLSRYHNYFIGFSDNNLDNKKKKKKIKYKSLSNGNKFFDEKRK